MAGEKHVNYTAEQTALILDLYSQGTAVETIAEKVGKTTRSIVAKLSREGVYQSKAKASGKSTRLTKAELVELIARKLDLELGDIASMEKASHEALELVSKALE